MTEETTQTTHASNIGYAYRNAKAACTVSHRDSEGNPAPCPGFEYNYYHPPQSPPTQAPNVPDLQDWGTVTITDTTGNASAYGQLETATPLGITISFQEGILEFFPWHSIRSIIRER